MRRRRQTHHPQTHSASHKDPINVSFLTIVKPDRPYQVLGKANVAKYNPVGIKRQEATLRDLMREQAADWMVMRSLIYTIVTRQRKRYVLPTRKS